MSGELKGGAASDGANHSHDLRRLLEGLLAGDLGLEDVIQRLRLLQVTHLGEFARLDVNRGLRKGVPEVIYAPRKRDADLAAIVRRFLVERGLALVTRLGPERAETLRLALERGEGAGVLRSGGADADGAGWDAASAGLVFEYNEDAEVLAARTSAYVAPELRGCVGLLTAGTADIPVAEEAALVLTYMGCRVIRGYDTGVAGVHRLLEPLTHMVEGGADVLVVVAGMEGALPSVVAGLVDLPVIGVPTSTGYGLGGDGTAAVYSMLQTCSPGLVVVNVDNGVGAGAAAALIARGRRN